MNLFKKYRVIEFNGKFIAQTRGCFMCDWKGLDRADFYLWYILDMQIKYCSFDTLEEAKEHLKKYKEFVKKPKIKYYYE
jgi:hypothetical protein